MLLFAVLITGCPDSLRSRAKGEAERAQPGQVAQLRKQMGDAPFEWSMCMDHVLFLFSTLNSVCFMEDDQVSELLASSLRGLYSKL